MVAAILDAEQQEAVVVEEEVPGGVAG
jgi:hypothetical protein